LPADRRVTPPPIRSPPQSSLYILARIIVLGGLHIVSSELQTTVALLSPAVTMLFTAFLALVIIYKNYHNEINRVFFFWMLISAANALFMCVYILFDSTVAYWTALFLSMLDPCMAIHFVLLYSMASRYVSRKPAAFLIYLPAVLAIPALVYMSTWGEGFMLLGYGAYSLAMYALEFFSIGLLMLTYRGLEDKVARRQVVWIAIGIFIMTFGVFLATAFSLIAEWLYNLVIFIIVPAAALVLAFTVLKFKILGVENIVKRGITYTMMSIILVCLFVMIGAVLEGLFRNMTWVGIHVPNILTALILAFLILPLQAGISKVVNKVLPKHEDPEVRRMRMQSYRTALCTAMADSVLTPKEKRILKDLRVSLAVTDEEHEEMIKNIKAGKR